MDCCVKVVHLLMLFCEKELHFLYNIVVSHWLADMLLAVIVLLDCLPPTIGPMLGASFLSQDFMPPLAEGWLLMHWAYSSGQRQRHKLRCWNIYYGTQVCSMKTLIHFSSKGSTTMNRHMSND